MKLVAVSFSNEIKSVKRGAHQFEKKKTPREEQYLFILKWGQKVCPN
jgi:hypothetical protein